MKLIAEAEFISDVMSGSVGLDQELGGLLHYTIHHELFRRIARQAGVFFAEGIVGLAHGVRGVQHAFTLVEVLAEVMLGAVNLALRVFRADLIAVVCERIGEEVL